MGKRIEKTDSYVTDNCFIGSALIAITQEARAMKTVPHVLQCFKLHETYFQFLINEINWRLQIVRMLPRTDAWQ